ncbi:MAG: 1-deoxy-D-xylulose-5-phosphate reductoisomerase [Acidimicrobiia bacterium]
MRSVAILGATGSIGRQTIEVVEAEAGAYEVVALGAGGSNLELLAAQARRLRPRVVALADASRAAELGPLLPAGTELVAGPDALATAAVTADIVVNGVVGFAGLTVTMAALEAGRRLALANKESLIAGGPVVAKARATPGAELIPIDSEHCAIHQCLRSSSRPEAEVARLVLTASGGPFRGRRRADLAHVTIDDALAHPTWSMGPKITVDSSTLMNKGLEVIEAHELFGIDYGRIEVVVHPQSVVHSMVEFTDAATVAQLSLPDMRLPIGYALAYPRRAGTGFGRVDWATVGRLDFELPDYDTFPCLALAYAAGRRGGTAPAWLNAANEIAVAAFLDGLISWNAIADVLNGTLDRHDGAAADGIDAVIDADHRARAEARRFIQTRTACLT